MIEEWKKKHKLGDKYKQINLEEIKFWRIKRNNEFYIILMDQKLYWNDMWTRSVVSQQ